MMGNDQLDLLDYPRTPGWQPPDTSIEAAEEIAPQVGRLQQLCLETIRAAGPDGLTADEVAARLELTPFSVRPRVTELSKLGLIEDSGVRGENPSGRRAIVWVAVPEGEEVS